MVIMFQYKALLIALCLNPIALRATRTLWRFGHFKCNRVKEHGYKFIFFQPFLQRDKTFMTSCLLPSWIAQAFQNESTLEGKNLLLKEQILSFKS